MMPTTPRLEAIKLLCQYNIFDLNKEKSKQWALTDLQNRIDLLNELYENKEINSLAEVVILKEKLKLLEIKSALDTI